MLPPRSSLPPRPTGAASGLLTTAIVGGAVLPLAVGALADQIGLQHALLLPVLSYAVIATFGLWMVNRRSAVQSR